MTVRRLTAQCLPPLRSKIAQATATLRNFKTSTSPMGAARPLPPSADIGPGGSPLVKLRNSAIQPMSFSAGGCWCRSWAE